MLNDKEKKHIKEAIYSEATTANYVTSHGIARLFNIDEKLANKMIHELEQEGLLEETWIRLYTLKNKTHEIYIE